MSDVERIKERADIAEIISSYVTLTPAGKNLKGPCPFHNEKTPSFFISPERQTYYCFGCGAKGDVIDFIEQYEGLDFLGSIKLLAEKLGIELSYQPGSKKNDSTRLYEALEKAAQFFEGQFRGSAEAAAYMRGRGFGEEVCGMWRVGYAGEEWRALYEHLTHEGVTETEIERAGLVRTSEKGNRVMDLFRHRIMFPIRDISGRIIAFSGRTLSREKDVPKYVNSPETDLFKKSGVLFGLYEARQAIRKMGYTILVEGQMDVLACHSAGIIHTVASSGTAFTIEQARILKRIAPRVVILFDADKAGKDAALRAAEIALTSGMETKIALLPEGKDPGDLFEKEKDVLRQSLREAKHAIEVATRFILLEEGRPERRIIRVNQEVIPLLLKLESDSLVDHFAALISRLLDISKAALVKDMERARSKTAEKLVPQDEFSLKELPDEKKSPDNRFMKVLSYALAFKKWKKSDSFEKEVAEILSLFSEEERNNMCENIDTHKILFEIERLYEGASEKELLRVAEDVLRNLRIEALKKKYEGIQDGKEKFLIRKEIDILKGKSST